MAYHRPKILTAITVPAGGWTFAYTFTITVSLDTARSFTIPAGTYYIAWDAQSDDLLFQLTDRLKDDIDTAVGAGSLRYPEFVLTEDNKVRLNLNGGIFNQNPERDFSIRWTASSADLAKALGYDESADDTSTGVGNAQFTGDYQHGYGWYAEEDGQLESLLVNDVDISATAQAVGYTGQASTQFLGARGTNAMQLNWLSRTLTHSGQAGYGEATSWPYLRNKGLECWWRQARTGTRFRVYREGRNDASAPIDRGVNDLEDTQAIRDSNKSFDITPWEEHAGKVAHIVSSIPVNVRRRRFYISSHTATQLNAPNVQPSETFWQDFAASEGTFYILDLRYETYILDASAMKRFAPEELPNIDRYGITLPLLRYES